MKTNLFATLYIVLIVMLPCITLGALDWEWIPSTSTPPRGRVYHSWITVPQREGIYLTSGTTGREESGTTWVFRMDVRRWERLQAKGDACPARAHALHWGVVVNGVPTILVFGGTRWGIGMLNDFCSFSMVTGSVQTIPLGVTANTPNGRSHSVPFSLNESVVGFFGGRTIVHVSRDLWLYNAPANLWTVLKDPASPPPRHSHASAYHKPSNCLFVFSGQPEHDVTPLGDFYKFNFTTMKWTFLNVSGPAARFDAAVTALGDYFVIAGGQNEDYVPMKDVWFFNVYSNVWVQKPDMDIGRSSATLTTYNNKGYLFGGMTTELGLVGDLFELDVSGSFHVIHYASSIPSPRALHATALLGTSISVNGGIDGTILFSDTWLFSTQTLKWTQLTPSGGSNGIRYSHSCIAAGGSLNYFGGTDGALTYNDVRKLVIHSSVWMVPVSVGPPSPRQRHNAASWQGKMIIFGGASGSVQFNEVWSYSLTTGIWKLLSGGTPTGDTIPPKVANAGMAILGDTMVTSGGYDNAAIYDAIWTFDLVTGKWKKSSTVLPLSLRRHVMVPLSTDTALIVGGETLFSNLRLNATAWVLRIVSTGITVTKWDVPENSRSGHSAVMNQNYLYVFGGNPPPGWGLRSIDLTSNELIRIPLIGIHDDCPAGSYLNTAGDCVPCLKGSYSETWNTKECTLCSPGSFNDQTGASSADFCIPCVAGSYASEPGTSRCSSCPPGYTCFLGSTIPVKTTDIQSQLPLETPKNSIGTVNSTLVYLINTFAGVAVGILIAVTIAVVAYLWFVKKLSLFQRVDFLFSHQHKCSTKGYRIQYSTTHGGIFSVVVIPLGLLLCITILSQLAVNRWQNAYTVPKYLFGSNAQDEGVDITATLLIQGCPLDWGVGLDNPCPDYVLVNGISLDKSKGTDSLRCVGGFTGRTTLRQCKIVYSCKHCYLVSNSQGEQQSSIIQFLVTHEKIYALQYSWTLAMTSVMSSDEIIGGTVQPPNNQVFRGTEPTDVAISTIPSMRYELDQWENVIVFGYTSVLSSVTTGTSVDEVTFPSKVNLNFRMKITPALDIFIDERQNVVPFNYIIILSIMSVGIVYSFASLCFMHFEHLFVSPKELQQYDALSQKDPTAYVSAAIHKAREKKLRGGSHGSPASRAGSDAGSDSGVDESFGDHSKH
eukprot:PhF_6_TR23300/c0_g1_i1/m.32878